MEFSESAAHELRGGLLRVWEDIQAMNGFRNATTEQIRMAVVRVEMELNSAVEEVNRELIKRDILFTIR